MKFYNKIMLIGNIIMTLIFMIPIMILFVNLAKYNFNFEEIKYSLAASVFGVIYISTSWYFFKLQKESK